MAKRLEITVFGMLYQVGALHLTNEAMETGVRLYGRPEWHKILQDVALGKPSKKKLSLKIAHALNHDLAPRFSAKGIAMNTEDFGLECFHNGTFMPINAVSSERPVIDIAGIMAKFSPGDMLGVYWARQPGSMMFRWDNVTDFDQKKITLVHEKLRALLGGKESLEIVMDISCRGESGQVAVKGHGPLLKHSHVFHRVGANRKKK